MGDPEPYYYLSLPSPLPNAPPPPMPPPHAGYGSKRRRRRRPLLRMPGLFRQQKCRTLRDDPSTPSTNRAAPPLESNAPSSAPAAATSRVFFHPTDASYDNHFTKMHDATVRASFMISTCTQIAIHSQMPTPRPVPTVDAAPDVAPGKMDEAVISYIGIMMMNV
jgi:hypothetical protein